MGIFTRIHDIVSSNVNNVLDKMEDPEKMVKLMINRLEEAEDKTKTSLAKTRASIVSVSKDLEQTKELMIRWENRATVAVENGQDDLAREALLEKRDCEEKVKNLEEQLSNYKAIGESQEAQLAQVVEKLSEVKAKEKTLIARARHAKEKQEVAKALEKCDCYKTMNRFNEMESRIERMEAKANMTYTNKTDCQFSKMEEEEEIEKELEKLKEKNK